MRAIWRYRFPTRPRPGRKSRSTAAPAVRSRKIAEKLGKAEFTVREWCRLELIRAKLACGPGNNQEWMVPHEQLMRVSADTRESIYAGRGEGESCWIRMSSCD